MAGVGVDSGVSVEDAVAGDEYEYGDGLCGWLDECVGGGVGGCLVGALQTAVGCEEG